MSLDMNFEISKRICIISQYDRILFLYRNIKSSKFSTTLISATSANPPTENRKNLRFKARAIDRPMLVFPTPGGPERQMIFPVIN